MEKNEKQYQGGKIKTLVETVAMMLANDPTLIPANVDRNSIDFGRLHASLRLSLPGYGLKEDCYNCGRSMQITEYTADLHDGLLLFAMAKAVAKNVDAGMPFTEANKIHIPTLPTTDAIRHRTTKASYLNLVKQPEGIKNSGYWVITNWGWKTLRGEEIPRSVEYWEGKLIGRSEEMTTLAQMFKTHVQLVNKAIELKKSVAADYRAAVVDYQPRDWVKYGEAVSAPGLF